MGMREHDGRNQTSANGPEQGSLMRMVDGAWIDQRKLMMSHKKTVRAGECERRRIWRGHPDNALHDGNGSTRLGIELGVEVKFWSGGGHCVPCNETVIDCGPDPTTREGVGPYQLRKV
ncbi:MAG: hypothetical protein Devi2KO_16720 [Devosia indica]